MESLTYATTPAFRLPEITKCKVLDVYDADSVVVAVDVGGTWCRFPVRLIGIDTPERRPRRDAPHADLEKRAALSAHRALIRMIVGDEACGAACNLHRRRVVRDLCGSCDRTLDLRTRGFDKYGRVLGELVDATGAAATLNERLVSEGWARVYGGGTRHPWTEAELRAIVEKADGETL